MVAEEFRQQFAGEPFELVVRISWCWTKKQGPFPQVGELCHARARFDQAIDGRTDALVGRGLFNWLEWLCPKKLLGHPYGYAFEEGHLYRVLVREAREHADNERRYYVEQLLEANVAEPRLDPLLQFGQAYGDEVVDRYLLIEDDPLGWANVFGYWRAGVRYLAVATGPTDEPRPCLGRLTWMEKARGDHPKTHFGELNAWQVQVRVGKDDPDSLMLVKAVKKLHEARFEAARAAYLKPVELQSTLGTFVLNRHYSWYEGTIDYLGADCSALLSVEEGSTDAQAQLARLEELCGDLAAADRAARSFAADELLDDACDWCEEELTRAQFMERMEVPSLSVELDGSVEFMFGDGDMFWGHVIVVDQAPDGTFTEATIAG